MRDLLDRVQPFRAAAIAVIVLVVSTGIVLAASGGTHGPGNANGHGPPASEQPDESESPDGPDESGGPGSGHGALVSAAAHMTTPAGFANHGAFVSCVAHMKDATLAKIDWSKVTPAACAAKSPKESEAP